MAWVSVERQYDMAYTILTNLTFFIGPVVVWYYVGFKKGAFEIVTSSLAGFISLMYHITEILQEENRRHVARVLGMKDGQWHRLDNVAAIVSMQWLLLHLSSFRDKQTIWVLRWVLMWFCLWCQEYSPWDVTYTVLPIVPAAIIFVCSYLFTCQLPKYNKNIYYGLFWFFLGLLCFSQGLDDKNDHVIIAGHTINRFWHNLWHCCVSMGFSFFFFCNDIAPKYSLPRSSKWD